MISAIVLAAGKSSRMGSQNKMLLPFRDSTVIGSVIDSLQLSIVDEIIVVENPDTNLAQQLDYDNKVKFVTNKSANKGLTSSIQCGLDAVNKTSSGYLICLGDMPLLTMSDYNILINNYLDIDNKAILLPIFNNMRGNPVLFSSHYKEDIMLLNDKNGCKPVVVANDDFVIEIPFFDNNCHTDIDTLKDYQQYK